MALDVSEEVLGIVGVLLGVGVSAFLFVSAIGAGDLYTFGAARAALGIVCSAIGLQGVIFIRKKSPWASPLMIGAGVLGVLPFNIYFIPAAAFLISAGAIFARKRAELVKYGL